MNTNFFVAIVMAFLYNVNVAIERLLEAVSDAVVSPAALLTPLYAIEQKGQGRMNTMETTTTKEYRARVRCNSCFKFSWVTILQGYDVNHNACGRCGQLNAVVYKLITIKPEHDGPRCAGPCQNSKSGDCECSCGGKNHGLHA